MDGREFQPGAALCRDFFHDLVEPVLGKEFPQLEYAAGLIGPGSEVLGYDDPMSADHHWGPRAMLFVADDQLPAWRDSIRDTLSRQLPVSFQGYPTNYPPPNPDDSGTQLLEEVSQGPVNHRVEVLRLAGYLERYLGIDLSQPMTAVDWLIVPGQKLKTVAEGAIFKDDRGELREVQGRLSYYPEQVWLYLLAAGWARIGQEEHFLGRTGWRGDELGSRLIGARLIHDLMNLCFLIERVYPPYSKWFGTAFQELSAADRLLPVFHQVLDAPDWQSRERQLVRAYEFTAEHFNALGLTESLPAKAVGFHGRPFLVIDADRFVQAILNRISDPEVREIADRTLIGGVEQFSTSTNLLSEAEICQKLTSLYL